MEEWLRSLDPEARVEVVLVMRLLREHGTALAMPSARYLREGIWELRARDSRGIYRVLYFHWKGRTFGVLHGFTKKSRATPPGELELAIQRHRIWMGRERRGKNPQ